MCDNLQKPYYVGACLKNHHNIKRLCRLVQAEPDLQADKGTVVICAGVQGEVGRFCIAKPRGIGEADFGIAFPPVRHPVVDMADWI